MMRARDAAVLSIKVLALFILIGFLDSVGGIIQNWYVFERELMGAERASLPFTIGFTILHIILVVIVAWVLWHNAGRIATRIFPSDEAGAPAQVQRTVTNQELVQIFLGVLGVWLIINSFPQLLSSVLSLVVFPNPNLRSEKFDYGTVQFQNILFTLFKFVAGCLLLVWQPLTRFFQSLIFFQSAEAGSLVRISTSPAQCPFCKEEISSPERWACRKCGAQHHLNCWEENQGCAVFGCSGST